MSNNKENSFRNKENYNDTLYKGVVEKSGAKNEQEKESGGFMTYAIIAVVAFIVGFGAGRLGNQNSIKPISNTDTDDKASSSNSSDSDAVLGGGTSYLGAKESLVVEDILAVDDQPAGLNVAVKKINLPKSAWLAIREDNGKGEPGNILGAQLFDPGMISGKVELLRNTEEGKIYYAAIFSDNGDRAFIPKMDLPILGANGRALSVMFKATK